MNIARNKMAVNEPNIEISNSLVSLNASDDLGRNRRRHDSPSEPNTPLRRVSSLNFVGSRQLHREPIDGSRPALKHSLLAGRHPTRDHNRAGEGVNTTIGVERGAVADFNVADGGYSDDEDSQRTLGPVVQHSTDDDSAVEALSGNESENSDHRYRSLTVDDYVDGQRSSLADFVPSRTDVAPLGESIISPHHSEKQRDIDVDFSHENQLRFHSHPTWARVDSDICLRNYDRQVRSCLGMGTVRHIDVPVRRESHRLSAASTGSSCDDEEVSGTTFKVVDGRNWSPVRHGFEPSTSAEVEHVIRPTFPFRRNNTNVLSVQDARSTTSSRGLPDMSTRDHQAERLNKCQRHSSQVKHFYNNFCKGDERHIRRSGYRQRNADIRSTENDEHLTTHHGVEYVTMDRQQFDGLLQQLSDLESTHSSQRAAVRRSDTTTRYSQRGRQQVSRPTNSNQDEISSDYLITQQHHGLGAVEEREQRRYESASNRVEGHLRNVSEASQPPRSGIQYPNKVNSNNACVVVDTYDMHDQFQQDVSTRPSDKRRVGHRRNLTESANDDFQRFPPGNQRTTKRSSDRKSTNNRCSPLRQHSKSQSRPRDNRDDNLRPPDQLQSRRRHADGVVNNKSDKQNGSRHITANNHENADGDDEQKTRNRSNSTSRHHRDIRHDRRQPGRRDKERESRSQRRSRRLSASDHTEDSDRSYSRDRRFHSRRN